MGMNVARLVVDDYLEVLVGDGGEGMVRGREGGEVEGVGGQVVLGGEGEL